MATEWLQSAALSAVTYALVRHRDLPDRRADQDADRHGPPQRPRLTLKTYAHARVADTRIKNTADELLRYDDPMNGLLDRILDEYGLIVCGWSADWDDALRAAFERCPNRRYMTYWAARGQPSDKAERLIQHRAAAVITIDGADKFFGDLAESVAAIESFAKPHPVSTAVLVARTKRYLEESARIPLNDLVTEETERLVAQVVPTVLPIGVRPDAAAAWPKLLERVANCVEKSEGGWYPDTKGLRHYPALMLLYAGGIASLIASNYALLGRLMNLTVRLGGGDGETTALKQLMPWRIVSSTVATELPEIGRRYTSISDRVWAILRTPLREHIPDDVQYDRLFDRFEFIRSLMLFDVATRDGDAQTTCPGRFCWRSQEHDVLAAIDREIEQMGGNWPPIRAGLFNLDRLRALKSPHDQRVSNQSL